MRLYKQLDIFAALRSGTRVCSKEAHKKLSTNLLAEGAIKTVTVNAGSIESAEVIWPSGRITTEPFHDLLEVYEGNDNPNLTFKMGKGGKHG